jgi:serine/threonine protein phosphatase PrpC
MTGIIQRIFGHQKTGQVEMPANTSTPTDTEKKIEPPQLIAGCAQSVGKQRDHNEDSLFMLSTTLATENGHIPFGLYIVADGMGGHKHGEIASSIAVRTLAAHIVQKLYTPLLNSKAAIPSESIQEILQDGILEAHRAILDEVPGGGTTLTAVLITGEQMTFAHVGDSRAYIITEDGNIKALTRDHSLVKRLVELGQITQEEAAVHPQRNVLYRALGQGEPFRPDISTSPLLRSGYLLLCSDGLWGVVPEEQLPQMVSASTTLRQACQKMVDAANEAGGPDNITAILVQTPD